MSGNVVVVKLQGINGLIDAVRSNEPLDRVYLAEGDSWFDFPAFRYFPSHVNLLTALNTDDKRTLVLSIANIGDKLKDMADEPQFEAYSKLLTKRFGMLFSGILLSGGGNDLLAHMADMLITPSSATYTEDDCCVAASEKAFFETTTGYLMQLLNARANTPNAQTPVFMHTYAFPTPRPIPTYLGPLLRVNPKGYFYRRFEKLGIHDMDIQRKIVARWLIKWQDILGEIGGKDETFHVIKSCNCLQPASPDWTEPRGDWYDEIHPRPDGFSKVAALFKDPLKEFSQPFDLLL